LFQIGFSEVFSSCGFPQHRQQEQREQSLWNSGYLEIFLDKQQEDELWIGIEG